MTAGKTAKGYIFMRKNKLFMMGTLAATLAFGLVLFGCEDDSGDTENTDPKKITITNLPSGTTGQVMIMLRSELSEDEEAIIAAGYGTIFGTSVTVSLKNPDGTSDWTGSGSYYLFLVTGEDNNQVLYFYTNGAELDTLTDPSKFPKITISETTTTVDFSKFVVAGGS
jgi:hypothetical protein